MGLLEVRGFGVGCEEHPKAGVDYTSLNLVSISEPFCRWPQKQVDRSRTASYPVDLKQLDATPYNWRSNRT